MVAAKLTEDLLESICSKVRGGVPFKTALASEGITNDMTPWRWKQRARERPGSIYGRFVEEVTKAQAESTVIDTLVVRNGATRSSTTITRKLEPARDAAGEFVYEERDGRRVQVMNELERTEVIRPPDPRWSAWMLEHRDRDFMPRQAVDATVTPGVPREVMARTIGEKLRQVQGGDPNVGSLMEPDDASFSTLMGTSP